MGDARVYRGTAKVPLPYMLPDKVTTLISLKKWFNVLGTYNKQNNEYLQFYPDGANEEWTAKSVNGTRGLTVPANPAGQGVDAADVITAPQAAQRTAELRRDLDTLLNNYASYVPESYYEMVIDDATSIKWIYDKLAQSLNLESSKQYILNSHSIRYQPDDGDTPEKLYMRLRGHYQQAAPKANSRFDGNVLNEDVRINPLVELMLVEKTLERIDPRLPAHIVKTRGHLMEDGNQTLFCVRRLLWNQIQTMLDELNMNGNGSINAANAGINFTNGSAWNRPRQNKSQYDSRRRQNTSSNRQNGNNTQQEFRSKQPAFQSSSGQNSRSNSRQTPNNMICGACFRAGKPQSQFMSHHYEDCRNLSSSDKKRMRQVAIRMIENNDDCTSSESEHEQEDDDNTQ